MALYTASDLMFGAPVPTLTGDGISGYGLSYGASNPQAAYFQSAAAGQNASSFAAPSAMGGVGSMNFAGPKLPSQSGGGFGFNMDTAQMLLGGLQTIGNLWQAWEANKLAKEQFQFQKEFSTTNLANQIKSYNTTLEDRGRSRAFTESQSAEEAAAYISNNRLADAKFS